MIYTSYFANYRKFPKDMKQVSIARYSPNIFRFCSIPCLMPSESLLKRFKSKEISELEYTLEYNEQLASLNPVTLASFHDNSIFL